MESQLTSDAGLPATDRSALDRLRRFGGQKLLAEMITLYLAAAPERLAAARAALGRSDPSGVEQALHALKSSAAQLGAMRMQRLSERGEALAMSGSLDGADALLTELEAEAERVHRWLAHARDEEHS